MIWSPPAVPLSPDRVQSAGWLANVKSNQKLRQHRVRRCWIPSIAPFAGMICGPRRGIGAVSAGIVAGPTAGLKHVGGHPLDRNSAPPLAGLAGEGKRDGVRVFRRLGQFPPLVVERRVIGQFKGAVIGRRRIFRRNDRGLVLERPCVFIVAELDDRDILISSRPAHAVGLRFFDRDEACGIPPPHQPHANYNDHENRDQAGHRAAAEKPEHLAGNFHRRIIPRKMHRIMAGESVKEGIAGEVVYCPACGYDLRGAASDRCSECGLPIVGGEAQQSRLQWYYRGRSGRWRAFWQTVWQVTSDIPEIRHETARVQYARSARVFRRWVTVVAAVAILTPVAAEMLDGMEPAINFERMFERGAVGVQMLWPWAAAMDVGWLRLLVTLLWAIPLVQVPRWVCRVSGVPEDYGQRAEALGDYAAGPMALLLPAVIMCSAYPFAREASLLAATGALAFTVIGGLLALGAILLTIVRGGQWYARIRHGRAGTVLLGILWMIGGWIGAGVLVLWFLPWCVGYVWFIVDSLR
jgi:hypothetical protein